MSKKNAVTEYDFSNLNPEQLLDYINSLPDEEKAELAQMIQSQGLAQVEQMMFFYVQFDNYGRVIGSSQLSGLITVETHGQEVFDRMQLMAEPSDHLHGSYYINGEFVQPPTSDEVVISIDQANNMLTASDRLGVSLSIMQKAQVTAAFAVDMNLVPLADGQEWQPGMNLVNGTIVTHNGQNWQVVQAHISHEDWTPDATSALFKQIREAYADWVQPRGAHDAYMRGDRVLWDGNVWVSDIDNNVWMPGAHGWSRAD